MKRDRSRFSVIRLPHKFIDEDKITSKRFVVIGHEKEFAICIKATSQIEVFKNNPSKMVGSVSFKANECECFDKDTLVEPDNQIPIRHDAITKADRDSTLTILGELPKDFGAKLIEAVENSETMSEMEQKRLLKILRRKQSVS